MNSADLLPDPAGQARIMQFVVLQMSVRVNTYTRLKSHMAEQDEDAKNHRLQLASARPILDT